jgi:Na+-translocating ferredoxin:NAD+ oxidoreductase subunit B
MIEIDDNVYRELQRNLDKLPISFPETESGVEIRILKHIFTPVQALVGSKLGFMPEPLDQIFSKFSETSLTLEQLEKNLDEMHDLGLILRTIKKKENPDTKLYAASAFILGFYEFQMNKMTEDYIHDVDQFFREGYMDELNKTKVPQLRTIPINHVVGIENNIANYSDFRKIFENCGEPIVLNECICRKKNDLTGRSCKVTNLRESCFSFRKAGMSYINRGLGRIIQKEEAFAIIDQAEKDGLVIQTGNSQRPLSLCLCCGDCCNLLVNEKPLEAPAQFFGSNYFAQVDEDLCSGCGICETRCQMDAIDMSEGISRILLPRCIGCGLCVTTCPETAIKLVEKEEAEQNIPPKNTVGTYLRIAKKKAELKKASK